MTEIGDCYLKRNGHLIRHAWDDGLRSWVAAEPIPAPKATHFRPMLATLYPGAVAFPVIAQPKLDGARCIARSSGLYSRDSRRFERLDHISEALAPLFSSNPDLVLDGEIWAPGLTLGEINGLVRSHGDQSLLAFWAFDVASAAPQGARLAALEDLVGQADNAAVRAVEAATIADQPALDFHYRQCLADGYEGQMIRNPDAPYKMARCPDLMKRKPVEDAEAAITAIAVSDAGRLVATLRTGCGLEFCAPVPGNGRDVARWRRMGDGLVGLEATYRFAGRLPDGAPRDAVVKLVHETARY